MIRISGLVALAVHAFDLALFARILLSWMRPPRGSVLAERVAPVLYLLTEPLLAPVRRLLRPYQGAAPIDFSPLLLIVILSVAEAIVLRLLFAAGL